jgi:ketosteroid isomerase-like protein
MEPDVMTLLEVIKAFNDEDFPTLVDRVDPDVTYTIPGRATVSGEFHGVDETMAAFRRLRERSGGTIALEPAVVLAGDGNVLFTGRVTAAHRGRTLDVTNAYAYRFRDGRLVEGRLFPGDLHPIEAFFAD